MDFESTRPDAYRSSFATSYELLIGAYGEVRPESPSLKVTLSPEYTKVFRPTTGYAQLISSHLHRLRGVDGASDLVKGEFCFYISSSRGLFTEILLADLGDCEFYFCLPSFCLVFVSFWGLFTEVMLLVGLDEGEFCLFT